MGNELRPGVFPGPLYRRDTALNALRGPAPEAPPLPGPVPPPFPLFARTVLPELPVGDRRIVPRSASECTIRTLSVLVQAQSAVVRGD